MNTAIQELFIQLEVEHPNLFNTHTLEGRKFINDYYKFFEMEKQQLIDAFYKGIQEQTARILINAEKTTPEEYYNETFKTKTK